jgi:hypothetical protein
MSIIKLVLLSIEIVYSILLILIWKKYGLLEKVLLNGAYLGISFWSIFAIIQLLLWFSGITGYDVTSEQHSFINILPGTIGSFAPRLCGVSLDPNRGGLLLVIYGYMILILSKPSKLKNFLFLFILLLLLSTISKTANTSAYTTYFLVMIWGIANKKISYRILLKSCVLLVPAILLLLYMFSRENISQKIDVSMTLKTILSTSDDSSGGIHFELIKRGMEIGSSNFKNLFWGNGIGASQEILQDILGNTKYANYHSMYISLFAETGLLALILYIIIYFLPVIYSRYYFPLLCGLAVFNIFYQLTFEPIFWFCVSLFWSGPLVNVSSKALDITRRRISASGRFAVLKDA